MGLDLNGVQFLLFAQQTGVDFSNTAMIGRQRLDLSRSEMKKLLKSYGYISNNKISRTIFMENQGYAESLFKYIGAKEIHSFDVSTYEGATHTHDMNEKIPAKLNERYSVVIDGGSLEHVFNFPIAIKNCMKMLRVGGHYLGITPANNFMGHGFYQFSPELYFSIFTPQNGFEITNLIAFEDKPEATWFTVKNPEKIKSRVLLVNSQPVYLLIIAKKIANADIFSSPPQQSDYVAMWSFNNKSAEQTQALENNLNKSNISIWAKNNLPFKIIHLIKSIMLGFGFKPNFFTPTEKYQPKSTIQKRKK